MEHPLLECAEESLVMSRATFLTELEPTFARSFFPPREDFGLAGQIAKAKDQSRDYRLAGRQVAA